MNGGRSRATGREDERVVLDSAPGSIEFRFHARDAHLVMNGPGEIAFRVRLDGEAPGEAHGLDVDATGAGVLREGRMYQLIRQHPPRERTLSIEFEAPGAQAYSFTFG